MLVLLIKFLGGLVEAKKPYRMQTVRLALKTRAAYLYRSTKL